MSLNDFQAALGASIREGTALEAVPDSAGFRFTLKVQRSWCRGRAAKGARLTLSILDVDLRQRLLDTWVASGGGAASVLTAEADAFLDFIASHLPDPSHALTICRLEQATLRASEGTAVLLTQPLPRDGGQCTRIGISAGRHAALVHFYADADQLFAAMAARSALPPVTAAPFVSILFAPGLDGLSRVATADDIALWNRLHTSTPPTLAELLEEGHAFETIETLAAAGALDVTRR
jgi:hypothetical protein